VIKRTDQVARPVAHRTSYLIKEQQLFAGNLKEHRVPAGFPERIAEDAIGYRYRCRPLLINLSGDPYLHVGISLFGPSKEVGNKSLGCLCDGAGMTFRNGSGFIEKLFLHDSFPPTAHTRIQFHAEMIITGTYFTHEGVAPGSHVQNSFPTF